MAEHPIVVLYTAVIGNYDELQPLRSMRGPNIASICYTDEPGCMSEGWATRPVEPCATVDGRVRQARFIKTHPHALLGSHDISIWIDANLELTVDPMELATFVETADVATFAYPATYGHRDCIYQEAQACMERSKDDPALIRRQMDRYLAEGYPAHNGLVETSIVVRRNSQRAAAFNNGWWREIIRGSRRDQLSFNYVAHKQGLRYAILPGCRMHSPFARHRPHAVSIYPS